MTNDQRIIPAPVAALLIAFVLIGLGGCVRSVKSDYEQHLAGSLSPRPTLPAAAIAASPTLASVDATGS